MSVARTPATNRRHLVSSGRYFAQGSRLKPSMNFFAAVRPHQLAFQNEVPKKTRARMTAPGASSQWISGNSSSDENTVTRFVALGVSKGSWVWLVRRSVAPGSGGS